MNNKGLTNNQKDRIANAIDVVFDVVKFNSDNLNSYQMQAVCDVMANVFLDGYLDGKDSHHIEFAKQFSSLVVDNDPEKTEKMRKEIDSK